MADQIERIDEKLQTISLDVVTLEDGDIPSMGIIINSLSELENLLDEVKQEICSDLTRALQGYVEQMVMAEVDGSGPLEEGIECLQEMVGSLKNEEEIKEAPSSLLEKLGYLETEQGKIKSEKPTEQKVEVVEEESIEIKEEDKELLGDFALESLESLASIEIGLIDLEQNPQDSETINAIFRPFHTIKGVSSFLNLEKINKLSHSAENLLDNARNGNIQIDQAVIDIILESVDMLKQMIQKVQEALEAGSPIDNRIDTASLKDRIAELNDPADQDKPLGEILIEKGVVSPEDVAEGLNRQKKEPGKKLGEIFVEEKKADPKSVISALRVQKKSGRGQVDLQVKVDTKKLDNLVDLTGELVINQAMLKQNESVLSLEDQKLYHTLNQLTQITSSLQKTAMGMRMVPIKATFQKMVRLIRDLAKNSGKQVLLQMSGEDTEIDRNVVEELYEPMVHMIRNAVDHGLETTEEREAQGKDRKGTVNLRAYQKGSNIIIEIEDNGRGLNKERIIEKAKSKDLITDESKMTDSEIYNLIFQAGFSTAEKITDVSGRGVGMDVVKKAIEKLRGRVEINSKPGRGSKFIISLPLTLAIIEGMLVRVGKERYIIPTLGIRESFRPEKSQYSTVEGKGEMILSRGSLMSMIRLDRILGVKGDCVDPWDGLVVTVEDNGTRRCFLLDELLGKEEVVIKSLGQFMKGVKGVAGGAIMGDGRVGLILDISGIFEITDGFVNKPLDIEEEASS